MPPLGEIHLFLVFVRASQADTPPEQRDDSTRKRGRPSSWPAEGVSRRFEIPNAGWVAVAMQPNREKR